MKDALNKLKLYLGHRLADYLTTQISSYQPFAVYAIPVLEQYMLPGDVLLVEGNTRISTAIKYLTQSTWSHSALYVGHTGIHASNGESCVLIEAEVSQGVIASPLSKYKDFNIRICRPINLAEKDAESIKQYVMSQLGKDYDLKHVWDLARYLFPTPPVPVRFRRRMLALGSGDPSRAVCSTMIAQAFQNVRYPVLPKISRPGRTMGFYYSEMEIMHIRHHSLFAPRDFDLSPYFRVVKPTIESGFDYKKLNWADDQENATTDGRLDVAESSSL